MGDNEGDVENRVLVGYGLGGPDRSKGQREHHLGVDYRRGYRFGVVGYQQY